MYFEKLLRTHDRKRTSSSTVLGQMNVHMQNSETRPLVHAICKINFKWIKHLNVTPENIKLLKKEIRKSSMTSSYEALPVQPSRLSDMGFIDKISKEFV